MWPEILAEWPHNGCAICQAKMQCRTDCLIEQEITAVTVATILQTSALRDFFDARCWSYCLVMDLGISYMKADTHKAYAFGAL